MPLVLKHRTTAQLYSCKLINRYDLEYYGLQYWESPELAEQERDSFLQGRGEQPAQWELVELEERQVKLGNVKLNNNPSRRLFLDGEGRLAARDVSSGEERE